MKNFLLHFSLVATVTLACATLASAKQADPAPASAATHQQNASPAQQTNEAQMPASGDTTTQEAKTFSGRIVKEDGGLVLKDPVTKVSYKLNDPAKARQYVDKQVKVTGKLEMDTNTISVESIVPIS